GGQGDLYKLPLLTKADVRRHLYFDIMSETHDKAQVMKITTSGSTGEPFICYADRAQLEFRWAAELRAEEWAGHRFGDPSVRLSRAEFGQKRVAEAQGRADAALANRTLFPVFERLDESLTELSQTLASVRPTFIDGDAEAFDFIARHLRKEASQLSCKPRGIMTYGQTLSTE